MTTTATIRHWAVNTITGEVLGSSTVNGLRRHIRHTVRWDVANGYGAGRWLFFHCSEEQLRDRYRIRVLKKEGALD